MPERTVSQHNIDIPYFEPETQREITFIGIELNKARAKPLARINILRHFEHDRTNFLPGSYLYIAYTNAIAEVQSLMRLNS